MKENIRILKRLLLESVEEAVRPTPEPELTDEDFEFTKRETDGFVRAAENSVKHYFKEFEITFRKGYDEDFPESIHKNFVIELEELDGKQVDIGAELVVSMYHDNWLKYREKKKGSPKFVAMFAMDYNWGNAISAQDEQLDTAVKKLYQKVKLRLKK